VKTKLKSTIILVQINYIHPFFNSLNIRAFLWSITSSINTIILDYLLKVAKSLSNMNKQPRSYLDLNLILWDI
jgi:hypothetical protein